MGTSAHISVIGDETVVDGALDHGFERLVELEQRWSRFLPGSEVSQLNRSSGSPVVVSEETYRLIDAAVVAWHKTDGLFDPTIEATMAAAGYDRSFGEIDSAVTERTASHRAAPTPADIELAPYTRSVKLPDDVTIDLGGIAKGAAADLVVSELRAGGAEGCCINIGGDLRVDGATPRAQGWLIELDCPGSDESLAIGIQSGAVCTSTTLRRRWPGPRGEEHHIRNPIDGRPLESDLLSTTVVAASAAQAEVLTKVLLAAGSVGMSEVFRSTDTTGAAVASDGRIIVDDGFVPFAEAAQAPAVGGRS